MNVLRKFTNFTPIFKVAVRLFCLAKKFLMQKDEETFHFELIHLIELKNEQIVI